MSGKFPRRLEFSLHLLVSGACHCVLDGNGNGGPTLTKKLLNSLAILQGSDITLLSYMNVSTILLPFP